MIRRFSVITVCLNAETTIETTIDSVLTQTNRQFEYIIIDGNSSDCTMQVVKSFEEKFLNKKIPFKWISEPDKGIYDAFNKGIGLAQGDWISFLGSDDRYTENAIKLYIENLSHKELDFGYCNVKVSDKIIDSVWSWYRFRRRMHIPHVGSFHSKKYFEKYGLFDTSYKIAGDYELLLRAKEELKTLKIDTVGVIMGEEGISNTQIKEVYQETTRAKRETAHISSFICQFDYFKWMLKYHIKKTMHALIR